jgi:mRNA interferase YafQ
MSGFKVFPSSKFKKDYKKFVHRIIHLEAIQETIIELSDKGHESIPQRKRPHKLIGEYVGCWECHAMPDLLIIWEQDNELKEIVLIRVGSHSELF